MGGEDESAIVLRRGYSKVILVFLVGMGVRGGIVRFSVLGVDLLSVYM